MACCSYPAETREVFYDKGTDDAKKDTGAHGHSVDSACPVRLFLTGQGSKTPVRVLLLPKFELGEMEGDFPGEAQCYYMESVDIFETAMQNCFAAGKVWIDLILKGTL